MSTRYVDFEGTEFATIAMAQPAPLGGGAKFSVWSMHPAICTVPAFATISAGQYTVEFLLTWVAIGTTQVKVQLVEIGGVPIVGDVYTLDVECLDADVYTTKVYGVGADASLEVPDILVDVEVQSGLEEAVVVVDGAIEVGARVDPSLEVGGEIEPTPLQVSVEIDEA